MTSPRAQRIAAVFRSVIEILPANRTFKTCSLYEYVESVICQMDDHTMNYGELSEFCIEAHGVLTSIGVEDSYENCTREHAIHLMELAALVCESWTKPSSITRQLWRNPFNTAGISRAIKSGTPLVNF